MSRSRTITHGRKIAVALLVAGAAVACTTTSAMPAGSVPASSSAAEPRVVGSTQKPDVSGLVAKARAAQNQHEWRLLREVQANLIKVVGPVAIGAARATYNRAVNDLTAATESGDSHARAHYRAELRALCGPDGLAAAFESCDAHVIAWGN